jgi:DNA-binding CsgD family transcriptional regulator
MSRSSHSGDGAIPPGAAGAGGDRAGARRASPGLSPREQEIARLAVDGLSNKEIGDALGLSQWTVATHLRRVFVKLRVHRRRELAARAVQLGLAGGAGPPPAG